MGGLALARGDVLGWDDPAMTCWAVDLSKVCRNLLLDCEVLRIDPVDDDLSTASDQDFLLVAFPQVLRCAQQHIFENRVDGGSLCRNDIRGGASTSIS